MTVDFVITIDPVKPLCLLNVLIHSLNLQTSRKFAVVFFNQTLLDENELFDALSVRPAFPYRFFNVDRGQFLGKYPIWDLYAFHDYLLRQDLLTDYSMSLHMEEFLDVDYVEKATDVLQRHDFDILFGNLTRTQLDYEDVQPILDTRTPGAFTQFLRERNLHEACHWAFKYHPRFSRARLRLGFRRAHLRKLYHFGFGKRLIPTASGFTKLAARYEDVHFMKRSFAERYNWFLRGQSMCFHDIHICEQPVVCELSKELQAVTDFPVHFNRSGP